jgi:hypothetical protein
MSTDLLAGRITSFRREQGFGTITLDDGRELKFDASICTMVPEEGTAVRVRVGPAKWGGGEKAVHVEPVEAADSFLAPKAKPTIENQLAAIEAEHLVAQLTESVLTAIVKDRFGGKLEDAPLLELLDAYYAGDPKRAVADGYLRHDAGGALDGVLGGLATLLAGVKLPPDVGDAGSVDDVIERVNQALRAAGDGRRVYALDTRAAWRGFYTLASDRAKRLAGTLPFATDPKDVA